MQLHSKMDNTVTNTNTSTSTMINHSGFMSEMVGAFYNYMADVYIEYNLLDEKPTKLIRPVKQEGNPDNDNDAAITDISHVEDIDDLSLEPKGNDEDIKKVVNVSGGEVQTFADYFLYKLYVNFGIKRRMVNDHIALLYYHKSLKGYKASELITMLCRHMMLDLGTMQIISLGIPKAMNLEDFTQRYNIDVNNAETNSTITSEVKQEKYRLYRFPEGTMMIYNPSLKKYNVEQLTAPDDIAAADEQEQMDHQPQQEQEAITQEIEKQFNSQFQSSDGQSTPRPAQFEFSTRRVVGTGRFNSTKTFLEMFNENNAISNTNLDNIPEELMRDKVLVFNIEHPENRIIAATTRNYNTLCAVYQLKSTSRAKEEWDAILATPLTNIDDIRVKFEGYAADMVSQIHVATFKIQVDQQSTDSPVQSTDSRVQSTDSPVQSTDSRVNLNMPEMVRSFEKKRADGTPEMVPIADIPLASLGVMVENRPKTFQGYIIYGVNGERTKIVNSKYKMLKKLKGNRPIAIEQWNTKNLFYLYWRLVRENLVVEFIKEFDIPGGWSYHQLFSWFANLTRAYAFHLFKSYHHSFVKKDMDKSMIPYTMKPLCGELHKQYMQNKVPISNTMVEQFLFQQPAGKIFWRLFAGFTNTN